MPPTQQGQLDCLARQKSSVSGAPPATTILRERGGGGRKEAKTHAPPPVRHTTLGQTDSADQEPTSEVGVQFYF